MTDEPRPIYPPKREKVCETYWGSHGCSLDAAIPHDVHRCTAFDFEGEPDEDDQYPEVWCCEFAEKSGQVRYNSGTHPPEWTGWRGPVTPYMPEKGGAR